MPNCPHGLGPGCSECDTGPWQPVAAQCDAINTYDLHTHRSFYAMLRRDVPRLAGMTPPEAEAIIQWARRTFGPDARCARAITELTQLQRRLAAVPVPRDIREAIGAILIGLRSGRDHTQGFLTDAISCDRTPEDYAIEFGEYLAQSAERLIAEINRSQRDGDNEIDGDIWREVLSAAYEFRKRADRAKGRSNQGGEHG